MTARRTKGSVAALLAAVAMTSGACGAPGERADGARGEAQRGRVARYEMRFGDDLSIDVTATFEAGLGTEFVIDDALDVRLDSVESASGGSDRWTWNRNVFDAPGCAAGCTVRYHYDLEKAAERFDTGEMVEKRAGAFVGAPSIWIARPVHAPPTAEYSVSVSVPAPFDFAWGLRKEGETYVGVFDDADESPYAAIGKLRRFQIGTPTQGFDVVVAGPDPDVGIDALLDWPRAALANVQTMFPAYPRVRPLLVIMVRHGDGIQDGTALGNGGASIRIEVGDATPKAELDADWMLTHEMTHLTLPGLRRTHHWAEEGMAVYLEPIMRAKRGIVPVADVWKEWLGSMNKGQPRGAEDALDGTRSWGRTYWGGALFWLQCDVAIRQAAAAPAAVGLPTGFQSVFTKGDISNKWPVEKLLSEMDAATGTNVVSALYAEQAPRGVPVDLDALFKKLGVSLENGEVVFSHDAPLAAVRDAIVVGPN